MWGLLWELQLLSTSTLSTLLYLYACKQTCQGKTVVFKDEKWSNWSKFDEYIKWVKCEVHPKANAVKAQAINEEEPASARLSLLHDLIWPHPATFETMPATAAKMANVKKKPVAPFPPIPETLPGLKPSNIIPSFKRNNRVITYLGEQFGHR